MNFDQNILFCEPIQKKLVWGEEIWGVSASKDNDCRTQSGKTLSYYYKDFPLLIKTITSNEDLSIQVHPNDKYASLHEAGSLGKKECWYILDCKKDAEIIAGQKTKSKEEFLKYFKSEDMDKILCRRPLKKGDFILLNPGCVHAILGGTKLIEVQQASDITYRIYDYGRGRELHTNKALDVIDFNCPPPQISNYNDKKQDVINLCRTDKFNVFLLRTQRNINFENKYEFICLSVFSGSGKINNNTLNSGDYIVIDKNITNISISGNLELIMATPPDINQVAQL